METFASDSTGITGVTRAILSNADSAEKTRVFASASSRVGVGLTGKTERRKGNAEHHPKRTLLLRAFFVAQGVRWPKM